MRIMRTSRCDSGMVFTCYFMVQLFYCVSPLIIVIGLNCTSNCLTQNTLANPLDSAKDECVNKININVYKQSAALSPGTA